MEYHGPFPGKRHQWSIAIGELSPEAQAFLLEEADQIVPSRVGSLPFKGRSNAHKTEDINPVSYDTCLRPLDI